MHTGGDMMHSDQWSDPRGEPFVAARPSRLRTWLLVILPGGGMLLGAAALMALGLAGERPGWWRDIDPRDKDVAAAAVRVENGAATQLTQIRRSEPSVSGAVGGGASEPWTIRVSSADANAWLAARLRPWLESQNAESGGIRWPDDLRAIEVRFDSGRIDVGASIRPHSGADEPPVAGASEQVLSTSLQPEFRAGGSLWLPATSTSIGRLSVPSSWALSRAAAGAKRAGIAHARPGADPTSSPELRDIISALSGERPAMTTPIIRIGDGRRVRLLKLEPRDDALYITCQTLPRETSRAEK